MCPNTPGEPAARQHGSAMFLDVKSEVRVEDLLRGLIIQSGNDAAITLAEGIGGSEDNFVGMMNKRAGRTRTHPFPFHQRLGPQRSRAKVTARDMAELSVHLIRDYPDYYHFFGEKDFTWNRIHQLNRNPLLTMNIGADGLKTGDTAEAGSGLSARRAQDGQRLILVVNGYKTAAERAEDSRKLLNWGFRAFDVRAFPTRRHGRARRGLWWRGGSVELTPQSPVKTFVPHGSTDKLTAKIVYQGPLAAPVEAGRGRRAANFSTASSMLRTPLETKAAVAWAPDATRRRRGVTDGQGLAARRLAASPDERRAAGSSRWRAARARASRRRRAARRSTRRPRARGRRRPASPAARRTPRGCAN